MNKNKKLIFVYNADSSLFNKVGDLVHKTILPKTYQCNLCGLTYSGVRMRSDWKEFVNSLLLKIKFLHKDEFLKQYPDRQNITFPIIFISQNDNLLELISTKEINQAKNLDELEKLVSRKISDNQLAF